MVRRSVLDQIFQEMRNIRHRLDDIENVFSKWDPQPVELSNTELLELPDHLRKTFLIVATKGECNATNTSNLTGRTRAIESNYLNQLARMGWLEKRRISRTMHFRPSTEKQLNQLFMPETKVSEKTIAKPNAPIAQQKTTRSAPNLLFKK